MYLYQYFCMAVICCLFFVKPVRYAASAFIVGWSIYLVYYFLLKPSADPNYYIISATIETAIAYAINKRFKLVSYLGYSLIFVNIYGYYLFINSFQSASYDFIYAIITTIQILILIFRGALNGVNRSYNHIFVVRLINFDSGQARVKMFKNKTHKKTNL